MVKEVEVLLLTEDSAKDAFETIKRFLFHGVQLVVEGCQTQKLYCEPANAKAKTAMTANQWRNTKNSRFEEEHTRKLLNAIVTVVKQGGFVIFHYDADEAWTDRREIAKSLFDEKILARIVRELNDDDPLAEDHLLTLVPYWSIESWAYQNVREAKSIVREGFDNEEIAKFEAWGKNRATLDEVDNTGKKASALKGEFNLRLVQSGWPASEVNELGTSFAAFVKTLADSEPFKAALKTTLWQVPEPK